MRQQYDVWVLRLMLGVVLADYVAQIPYYLDLYYLPHRLPPSLPGTFALALTLAWFLAGYVLLRRGSRAGYWVLLSFTMTEFAFYLWNNVTQLLRGDQPFFHLQARDPVLVVVFAIGYLNFLAGAVFIYFLLRHCTRLIEGGSTAETREVSAQGEMHGKL